MTEQGIVTPEAVRLELTTANLGSRSLALLLDVLAQAGALILLSVAGIALADGIGRALPSWVGAAAVIVGAFAVLWGYPTAFETLWRGRTPGKAALGLRVVTVEGAPVRFRHAAIRAMLGLVDVYATAGAVAVLSVLFSRRQQRLGDLVAGTIVLRERAGSGPLQAARFAVPDQASGYAETVDPAGLTAGDYAAVRSFILRAEDLRPDARARVGEQLAARIAGRIAHQRPASVPPELFLRVVAARYQQRGRPETAGPPPAPPGTDDVLPPI